MKLFQDKEGNTSSKRIIGTILIAIGVCLLLSIGVVSIFRVIADPDTAMESGKTILIAGASLIGAGVLEFFGGKK